MGLTPLNKLIRKTIVPFLLDLKEEGNLIPEVEKMVFVQRIDKDELIEKRTNINVKIIMKSNSKEFSPF